LRGVAPLSSLSHDDTTETHLLKSLSDKLRRRLGSEVLAISNPLIKVRVVMIEADGNFPFDVSMNSPCSTFSSSSGTTSTTRNEVPSSACSVRASVRHSGKAADPKGLRTPRKPSFAERRLGVETARSIATCGRRSALLDLGFGRWGEAEERRDCALVTITDALQFYG
jgi:hypothetical protein